jgi:hypothetical protein
MGWSAKNGERPATCACRAKILLFIIRKSALAASRFAARYHAGLPDRRRDLARAFLSPPERSSPVVTCNCLGEMIKRSQRFIRHRYAFARVGTLLVVALLVVLAAAALWGQTRQRSQTGSLEAWEKIVAVVQHPRCLNCHQLDSPLQGDTRRLPEICAG